MLSLLELFLPLYENHLLFLFNWQVEIYIPQNKLGLPDLCSLYFVHLLIITLMLFHCKMCLAAWLLHQFITFLRAGIALTRQANIPKLIWCIFPLNSMILHQM